MIIPGQIRVAGAVVAAAAVAALWWLVQDHADLRREAARTQACTAAVGERPNAPDPVRVCPPPIVRAAAESRLYRGCDAALKANDLYLVRAGCSAEVKRVQADRDALRRETASLRQDLEAARAERVAAVGRAESRARAETERTLRAEADRKAAVRGPDGRRACDADCLRRRAARWSDPAERAP